MKMLVPAPYEAPKKKAEKEAKKTRGGLRRQGTSDTIFEDSEARSSSKEDEEEEESQSPQRGEERKGWPPHTWRVSRLRREKLPFRRNLLPPPTAARSGIPGSSPWRNHEYIRPGHVCVSRLTVVQRLTHCVMSFLQSGQVPRRTILIGGFTGFGCYGQRDTPKGPFPKTFERHRGLIPEGARPRRG